MVELNEVLREIIENQENNDLTVEQVMKQHFKRIVLFISKYNLRSAR